MGCILNLNSVILVGRLTETPDLRITKSGIAVTEFVIAVNRPRSEDSQQSADFIRCVAWRETAEFITKYFSKGNSICVQGRIQTRSWKDPGGKTRYATEVVVTNASFTEKREDNPAEKAEPLSANDDLPF